MLSIISLVDATVSRNIVNKQITYTTTMSSSYSKGYWSIYEYIPTDCSISSISCSSGNVGCNYETSTRTLRIVAYAAEAGGLIPTSVTVTPLGTGSCSLAQGQYVESYTGTPGNAVSLPTATLSYCNSKADANCDGAINAEEMHTAGNLYVLATSWTQLQMTHVIQAYYGAYIGPE